VVFQATIDPGADQNNVHPVGTRFCFFTRVTGPAPAAVTMAERKGTMKVQDGGGEQR